MGFFVRNYDNYHYMDEAEAYNKGDYKTFEEAEEKARSVVVEVISDFYRNGIEADKLMSYFAMFGEEPVILSDNGLKKVRDFSARNYAQQLVDEIITTLNDTNGVQEAYQKAIKFATLAHQQVNQTIPDSNIPYNVHLCNVAMEVFVAAAHTPDFNLKLAVTVALLHDILEDTNVTFYELAKDFGIAVAGCVFALTKDKEIPKKKRMANSLERIKKFPKEVWAVKLADRITNLQPPPKSWSKVKWANYLEEAKLIYNALKDGNKYLAYRLLEKLNGIERHNGTINKQ